MTPVKIRAGGKWKWSWNGWTSSAHEFLEERPWTPLVIGGRLCFSARDGKTWRVVHGDRLGKPYDDAFDTDELEGYPLYIAREASQWLLVLGERESQRFPHQITFRIEEGRAWIHRFTQQPPSGSGLEPKWR